MIDVSSPKQASELLRKHGLRPVKRLGQNFLCDRNTLDRIVRAANLPSDDPVVEIGGGIGGLLPPPSPSPPTPTPLEDHLHPHAHLPANTGPPPNQRPHFPQF